MCECCGAKIIEYEFRFNAGLRSCLRKLAEWGDRPVKVKELGLTTSEWTNFAKLRYWGLAENEMGKDSRHKGGVWGITALGLDFVHGRCHIFDTAVVCRNVVKERKGTRIMFDGSAAKIKPEYDHRGDYRQQVKDQIYVSPGQTSLLSEVR